MDGTLTIKTRPYDGESLTAFLMRTAVRNKIPYLSLIDSVDIKRSKGFHLDYNPKFVTDLTKLCWLLEIDRKEFKSCSLGSIIELFLDEEQQLSHSYLDFYYQMLDTSYRKFCPLCLKEKNAYMLFWQISDIKVCLNHGVELTSKCPSCHQDQPYLSPSLIERECYLCKEKLSKSNHINFKKIVLSSEQSRLYHLWNSILNNEYKPKMYNGISKSEDIALRILYFCSDNKERYVSSDVKFLTPSGKWRLSSFVKGGKEYKPTMHLILNVLNKSGLEFSDLFEKEIPITFITSVKQLNQHRNWYSEIPLCQSPWCNSYNTSNTMIRAKPLSWETEKYFKAYMCTCCYVKYGRKTNGDYCEIGESYIWAYNNILTIFRERYSELKIMNILNCSNLKVVKYSVYFSVQGLLDKVNNIPIDPVRAPVDYFKRTRCRNVIPLMQAYGWGMREYFYYLYNKEVQLYLYAKHELIRNDRENTRENKYKDQLPDRETLMNLAKGYIEEKNEVGEVISEYRLYRNMNTYRRTLLKYHPEVVEYVEKEKEAQKLNKARSIEDERIERIKEAFDIIITHGEYPSMVRVTEASEVSKKYIQTHPRVKEVFLDLRRKYIEE
ncbi:TniQ family protein [Paenibacillus sp. USHLN196]|uniref:TniQ family protein n=1 Tax=Paenibacillus sp. USHLN196 TaxID=3081291 RepID=UPI0030174D7A